MPTTRSLTSLGSASWILPVVVIGCFFVAPPMLYVLYLVYHRIYLSYTGIPYSVRSSKSTSLTMSKPSRVSESSYRYKGYLTIINGGNGWCEYDFKWKYRNLAYMIEIRYASEEERPIHLLMNGQLLGLACEKTSLGWGWSNLDREYITCTYGPFTSALREVNTLRLESTAENFPHVKQVSIQLPNKKVGMRIPVTLLAHLEEEGDREFPDGHTAQSQHSSGLRRLSGFSISPKFPPGHDVRLQYSVLMKGGAATGAIGEGDFCGNRGSYEHGWRDLYVVCIWLEGLDKDKFTVFYRCHVKGNVAASVWCSNGQPCPHESNTTPIVALSVLIEEAGAGCLALVDFGREVEPHNVGFVTANLTEKTKVLRSHKGSGTLDVLDKEKRKEIYGTALRGADAMVTKAKSTVYTTMQAKYIEHKQRPHLGAFSISPVFSPGHEVKAKYCATMRQGEMTGTVGQGQFCGNNCDFENGWRDLVVVRVWLEGPDSDAYSVFYRSLVRGALDTSVWRWDGEACPHVDNTEPIVGLSVLIVAADGERCNVDDWDCDSNMCIVNVGALAGGHQTNHKHSNRVTVKRAAKVNPLAPAPIAPLRTLHSHVKKERVDRAAVDSEGGAGCMPQPETVFSQRLEYIKRCIKDEVMTNTLGKRNIDALYAGRPYMLPVTLSAYFDIDGESVFVDGALAVARTPSRALCAFSLDPIFPDGIRAVLKYCAVVRGGIQIDTVTHGHFCGNRTNHAMRYRDLQVIRIWLDGPDKDKFTVFYRCLLRDATVESAWCRDGNECPYPGNSEVIVGLCVVMEERDVVQVPGKEMQLSEDISNAPAQDISREGVTVLPKVRRRGGGVPRVGNHWADAMRPCGNRTPEARLLLEEAKEQLRSGIIDKDVYIHRVECILKEENDQKV